MPLKASEFWFDTSEPLIPSSRNIKESLPTIVDDKEQSIEFMEFVENKTESAFQQKATKLAMAKKRSVKQTESIEREDVKQYTIIKPPVPASHIKITFPINNLKGAGIEFKIGEEQPDAIVEIESTMPTTSTEICSEKRNA